MSSKKHGYAVLFSRCAFLQSVFIEIWEAMSTPFSRSKSPYLFVPCHRREGQPHTTARASPSPPLLRAMDCDIWFLIGNAINPKHPLVCSPQSPGHSSSCWGAGVHPCALVGRGHTQLTMVAKLQLRELPQGGSTTSSCPTWQALWRCRRARVPRALGHLGQRVPKGRSPPKKESSKKEVLVEIPK